MAKDRRDEAAVGRALREALGSAASRPNAAQLEVLFATALDAIVTMDGDGLITAWNPRAATLFGWSAEDAIGRPVGDTIVPEAYREAHQQGLRKYMAGGAGPVLGQVIEISAVDRSGREFPVELAISPAFHADEKVTFIAFLRDISARQKGQLLQALRIAVSSVLASAATWQDAVPQVLAAIGSGLDWDLANLWELDQEGERLACVQVWERPGVHPEHFIEATRALRLAPGEGLPGRAWALGAAASIADVRDDVALPRQRLAREAGLQRGLGFPVFNGDAVSGVIELFSRAPGSVDPDLESVMTDIGRQLGHFVQLRRAEEALRRQAMHDPLTELPNRTLFFDRVDQELRSAQRSGGPFAVMIVDLDGFKEVNDSLGHSGGDTVLTRAGERITIAVRVSDTVARMGGDEFALLLKGADRDQARTIAAKVHAALLEPIRVEGVEIEVGASIGIAVYPEHGQGREELLRHADTAMYAAKEARSGYATYVPGEEHDGSGRLLLMADLRRAMETAQQLVLHYQPKLDLASGRITAVEALVRWDHATQGLLYPDAFVGMAEQIGLTRMLTLAVLDAALAQLRRWSAGGLELGVAVNISQRNLQDREFGKQLEALVSRHGVAPASLTLEITETAIMSDPESTLGTLQQIRDLGARVSIDDFGVGYSSLSYLKRLQVDEVKIDKGFCIDMRHDDAMLVRASIEMAHALSLQAVAEGVEGAETLRLLKTFGCDVAQGYHIARPVPPEDLVAAIQHWDLAEMTG